MEEVLLAIDIVQIFVLGYIWTLFLIQDEGSAVALISYINFYYSNKISWPRFWGISYINISMTVIKLVDHIF